MFEERDKYREHGKIRTELIRYVDTKPKECISQIPRLQPGRIWASAVAIFPQSHCERMGEAKLNRQRTWAEFTIILIMNIICAVAPTDAFQGQHYPYILSLVPALHGLRQ
jgi:hypothetical protein